MVKNVIVWDKVVHGLNYMNYAHTYELCIYFCKGKVFPNTEKTGHYKDIWHIKREINNISNEVHHETQKPLKVLDVPIIHLSKEGDLILDPFMGTGQTAIACVRNGRNFLGWELDKTYFEQIEQRLKFEKQQKKLFEVV